MASKRLDVFCISCFTILFVIITHSSGDIDGLVSYGVPQPLEDDVFVSVLDLKSVHNNARYRRDVGNVTTTSTTASNPVTTKTTTTTTVVPVTTTRQTTTTTSSVTTAPSENVEETTTQLKIKTSNHAYYESIIIPESVSEHWQDLANAKRHKTLSENHRTAVTIPLSFKFRFYGHNITKVTVATGGFLYASPFLHQWLTATQYIAPLMANFDTTLGKLSDILYDDFGDRFVVQWRDVFLQDQNTTEAFNFQVILMKDGTIKFLYKTLPISVTKISKKNHPVKIGLSDAFYIDTVLKEYGVKRRTIYEYHRVSFDLEQVEQGTVIILKPLPTCNILEDCRLCVNHKNVKFNCQWCNAVQRCSDGFDWKREQWLKEGCSHINSTLSDCYPSTTTTYMVSSSKLQTKTSATTAAVTPMKSKTTCDENSTESSCTVTHDHFPIGATIAVILILLLVFGGLAVWLFYAYTHPTTASGLWLMEHRPSQLKVKMSNMKFWKTEDTSGSKYAVETTA